MALERVYLRPGYSSVHFLSLASPSSDAPGNRPVKRAVESVISGQAPDCGLSGMSAVLVESQDLLNSDLVRALWIAAVLVLLVFMFAYRIGWLALTFVLPIALGIAWGLAAYTAVGGPITLLAATVPTLLLGIGIDHCIHLVQGSRYALREQGLPRPDAVWAAWHRLIRPISLGSLTTAGASAALTLSELTGLASFLSGGSLCLPSSVLILSNGCSTLTRSGIHAASSCSLAVLPRSGVETRGILWRRDELIPTLGRRRLADNAVLPEHDGMPDPSIH